MKPKKYDAVVAQHPEIANIVREGCPGGLVEPDPRVLKSYIRKDIEYIAVRPFETLDLNSAATVEITPTHSWDSTMYKINYRVQGSRQYSLWAYVAEDIISLADAIAWIRKWYSEHRQYFDPAVDPLVWTNIVRVRSHGRIGHVTVSIEIFNFPADF